MEQKNDEKYDLYTEHIVPNTGEKIKRGLKKALMTAVLAIFFGVTAGLVMLLVYHTGKDKIDDPTKEQVKLPVGEEEGNVTHSGENITVTVPEESTENTTEAGTELVVEWNEELKNQLLNIDSSYDALKAVSDSVNQSAVTVRKYTNMVFGSGNNYRNSNDSFGIVLAEDSNSYYILTDALFVSESDVVSVTFCNQKTVPAEFVEKDSTTNFAVLRTSKEGLTDIKIAVLGDTKGIAAGDVAVAVGDLYGFTDAMGFGMVTGSNLTVSDTDSEFKLIITDIVGTENSFGVIANINGNVVGIITTNYNSGSSNHITAYSAECVTDIIEKLMNGQKNPYFGIKGEAVTSYMADSYGMPEGIYVSAVETNSPAYYAGIQPGDIISAISGINVYSMEKFGEILQTKEDGNAIEVKVQRQGREKYKEIVFTVTLGVE